jgi:alpha-N-arabinofuranosidase
MGWYPFVMSCHLGVLYLLLSLTPALAQDAEIHVNAGRKLDFEIPRSIYGTFLEPIGDSIYGGLWAQILANPSLEGGLWSLTRIRDMAEANPALYRASDLDLPLPWEPLDARQGARYAPLWNDRANSYRSLLIMAVADGETGIRQQVYLPVHRVLRYTGSLHVRHRGGPPSLEVSLRKRNQPDQVLVKAPVSLQPPADWRRYEFSLELKKGQIGSLEPVDFVVSLSGGTRVAIDQILLWPADHVEGMDPEMIELSRALNTPLVRFGGNFTSAYHWRDGIGPMDQRVSMLNLAWGMPEYNHFGTDELLGFCRLIGAEPQIALNLGTGTPEDAADWVRYVNQKWNNGAGGLMWELGNELWGDFQHGYPPEEQIGALTSSFSKAVRAADPKARLIATGQDPDHFEKWNANLLANPEGTFHYLATHFVVGTGEVLRQNSSPDFVALSAFALPVELERRLRQMKQQIDSYAEHRNKVQIAFTEWLFWGANDRAPRFHNMGGAIAAAGMLNTLIRTADFTPISDMTGLVEFGGIWKKRGRVYGVPAYWAFRMYSTADAAIPVEVSTKSETYDIESGVRRLPKITAVPYLDVVAALNASGDKLTLFCLNRHLTKDFATAIELAGFSPAKRARVQTLEAASIYQVNNEMQPDAVRPVESAITISTPTLKYTFPRTSVTVIEIGRE